MHKIHLHIVLSLLVLVPSVISQHTIFGTVANVIDGQTLSIATNQNSELTVRLIGIETPEDGQPLFEIIVEHLTLLSKGKIVAVQVIGLDDAIFYGQVVVDGKDVGKQMVRDGAAWFNNDDLGVSMGETTEYIANERVARLENRGIWGIIGLKRPSEIRKIIEKSSDPLTNADISQLAWEQFGSSVEGVFGTESLTSWSGECSGRVVDVVDGDTVKIIAASGMMTVRLAGIDAPEKTQAFGMEAKQHLSALIAGRNVTCKAVKRDRYGRTIGQISLNGVDINLSMVNDGYAWHYKEYVGEQSPSDRIAYSHAESIARSGRLGLWQQDNPVYPADFRRGYFLARFGGPSFSDAGISSYTAGYGGAGTSGRGFGPVRVRSYTRSNGTQVRSYTRSRPH